jgi:putative NADH-flavin reductase
MRIFVLGASGHTGTHILDLALARSHEVTAFTRSPKKIARQHPGLSVVRGDPHNVDELAKAMRGHDAVLSAIGVQPPTAFRHHTVIQDCAAATTRALERSGVQRLVLVSAAVLFPIEGVLYALFRLLLKHVARDLNAAEVIVRQSPLEWTIARPPRLTNGPGES